MMSNQLTVTPYPYVVNVLWWPDGNLFVILHEITMWLGGLWTVTPAMQQFRQKYTHEEFHNIYRNITRFQDGIKIDKNP
jgi:deferrochelatase/peroxidase EfeB